VDSEVPERRFSLQKHIFEAQLQTENDLLESEMNAAFLSDRSAIDPIVYLTHYSGNAVASRITSTTEWKSCRERYADCERSVIVLLLPVAKFLVDDNIRYVAKSEKDWTALANTFRAFMKEEGISILEIGEERSDIQDRVAMVLDQVGVDKDGSNKECRHEL
jgi:predicted ATPase